MDIIEQTYYTQKDIDRFWSKTNKTLGCWNWKAGLSTDGYGKMSFKRNGKAVTFRAHRLAFYFEFGIIHADKLVCHTCDNPLCINPKHLFEGTVQNNHDDMHSKNRWSPTKGKQLSLLTNEQVCDIRKRVANGEKQIAVARELKLGKNQIWHIVKGTTWKHLQNSS